MALSKGASIAIVTVICLLLGVLIGFLIGWFSRAPHDAVILRHVPSKLVEDADNEIRDKILSYVSPEKLREYSRQQTSESHLAGTKTDSRNAQNLLKFWKGLGLEAEIKSYKVLLTFPSGSIASSNFVSWADGGYHRTRAYEPQVGKFSYPGQIVTPFNAYSAAATVFGELVYVNYGREEDFEFLEEEYKVNFTSRIVVARYGKCFRGTKVRNAERWKAAGIVLFTAPANYAPDEWKRERYPKGIFMPPHGVQRGSVFLAKGDPETPGYPSIEGAYRESEEDINFPTIPVLPISYSDARQLLRIKNGNSFEEHHLTKTNPLPASWDHKLGIPNGRDVSRFYEWQSYGSSYSRKVNLTVNVTKTIRKINNVQAIIKGQVEEDRYVIIGNHRDAWVYGAADPSSGTAVVKEVSRVFAQLLEEGWKPRRSILLCSWSGEEQSLIGSYEWAEEFSHLISSRAVAYVNVDSAVRGNQTFRGRAMPLLKDLMIDVASHIPDPNSTEENPATILDTWKFYYPPLNSKNQPNVEPLTLFSDNAVFMSRLGVSSVDFSYDYGPETYPFDKYPLYHTRYDTFDMMEKFVDPDFKVHAAVAKFTLEFVRRLADNYVLPFKPSAYAQELIDDLIKYQRHIEFSYEAYNADVEPAINRLNESLVEFLENAIDFEDNLSELNRDNPILMRRMNDRLTNVEKCFLDYQGLPKNRLSNHLVFSQAIHQPHKISSLPGLYDVTYEASRKMQYNLKVKKWKDVLKHLSVLRGFVKQAAKTLSKSFI